MQILPCAKNQDNNYDGKSLSKLNLMINQLSMKVNNCSYLLDEHNALQSVEAIQLY